MLLGQVEYARPGSVDEAIRLLSSNENARALAGGQSLVNVMKVRVAAPDLVVDLNRIDDLRTIAPVTGGIEIGAMATYDEIIRSPDVRAARPILASAAIASSAPSFARATSRCASASLPQSARAARDAASPDATASR